MPRVAPRTTRDRWLHLLGGAEPDLEGDVSLAPSNKFLNWRFEDLDEDNDPDGLRVVMPEMPDGFWVYASFVPAAGVDADPGPLSAQNTEAIDIDEDSWTQNTQWISGQAPTSQAFAAKIAPPGAPTLEVVAAAKTGFKAGTYKLSYTWIKKTRHTQLAPPIDLAVGQGQGIRIFLPDDPPEGATHIGIWVSAPDGGFRSLRLQKVMNVRHGIKDSIFLPGPWIAKRKGPEKNETGKPAPRTPKARKAQGSGKSKAGTFKIRATELDEESGEETVPSGFSDVVNITSADAANGVQLEMVHHHGGRDHKSPSSHAIAASASSGQFNVFVTHNEGTERRFNPGPPGSHRPLDIRHGVPKTSGHTEDEQFARKSPVAGRLQDAKASEEGDIAATGRTGGGGGGLDDPTSELPGAIAEGLVLPDAGKYTFALSFDVRGIESVKGVTRSISITAGQTIKVSFPDPTNLLRNSQMIDLDSDGRPDQWTVTGVGIDANTGRMRIDEDGSVILDTNGAKTGSQQTPEISQIVPINQNHFYAIGGFASSTIVAGQAEVVVQQETDTNTLLSTHQLFAYQTTGFHRFGTTTFGVGQTIAINPSAAQFRVRIFFSGATRNGTLDIEELFVHPKQVERIRRRSHPHHGAREHTDSNPGPQVRHRKHGDKGVETPPVDTGTAPSSGTPSLSDVGFESGFPGDWTQVVSGGSGTAVVQGISAIQGTQGWNISKATTGARVVYMKKSFGTGTQRAVRWLVRVNQKSSKGWTFLGTIRNTDSLTGDLLAAVKFTSGGDVILRYLRNVGQQDSFGEVQAAGNVQDGEVLDLELQVDQASTSSGRARLGVGRNGANRTYTNWVAGLPYTNRAANWVHAGVPVNEDNSTKWNFDIDSVSVTNTGFSGTNPPPGGGQPPYIGTPPDPDRPPKTGGWDDVDVLGNPIYQIYYYLPPDSPPRDDIGPRDMRLAVQPGADYTISLQARYSSVEGPAYPFFFTAFDIDGGEHPLGSVFGTNGATGTSAFATRSLSFTVPNDCYVIEMDSRQLAGGIWVFQSLAISKHPTTATREVTYPATGTINGVLRTSVPEAWDLLNIENKWLNLYTIVDTPPGTSASVAYESADSPNLPPVYPYTDPATVPPNMEFLHFSIQLNASSNLRIAPTLRTSTPYVDYYSAYGGQQAPTLLRDDLSEFAGGVYLYNVGFDRSLSQWDIRFTGEGKVRRHRRHEPIGSLPGFQIRAFTRETMREIEENCLSKDFVLEAYDQRILIRFIEQIEFGLEDYPYRIDARWYVKATADVSSVEVEDVQQINSLSGVSVPP